MLYYLTYNIKDTLLSYKTYDYERIRWSASPYPWETILFVPSWIIPTPVMNQPWIPIATTVAIVAFFGMTVEAKQTYRQYTDFLGLGTCMRKFKRSQNQDHAHPVDSSGGTQHSGKDLLPNSKKHTIMK
jgi:pheromone a factor receptor